jgi:hypothetical protein
MYKTNLFLAALIVCLCSNFIYAGQMRFWIAHQENYNDKQGLFLRLQSNWSGDESGQLKDVSLLAGVANGKHWRTATLKPDWKTHHRYTVTMSYDGKLITLKLDNQQTQSRQKIEFFPTTNTTLLKAGLEPGWAQHGGPRNFQIIQHHIRITRPGQPDIASDMLREELTQSNLWLFEPSVSKTFDCPFTEGKPFEIVAVFSILPLPDIKKLPAVVDRYGQPIDGQWPEKITSDEQLRQSYSDEINRLSQWPSPQNVDDFGGRTDLGFAEKPTGFWRVIRREGVYWLITPQGNPCYYTGICGVPAIVFPVTCTDGRENLFAELPAKTGDFAAAWIRQTERHTDSEHVYNMLSWQASNLIRKFGSDWKSQSIQLAKLRINKWGFSGVGKWGGFVGGGNTESDMTGNTCVPVLNWGNTPKITDEHPDIFNPNIRQIAEQELDKQIKPYLNNPYILGWSLTNERRGIIKTHQIIELLKLESHVPAKQALIDFATNEIYGGDYSTLSASWEINVKNRQQLLDSFAMNPPKEDIQKLRLFMMDRYHAFIYQTFKKLDPNHMFLSFWLVPGWWEDENDWLIPAKYCDIMGYDRYNDEFAPDWLEKLIKQSDKPVICGEYSFPPYNHGQRGHGQFKVSAVDDADAGRKYAINLKTAATHSHVVGQLWFVYRDQPITGRDATFNGKVVQGECFGFGLVDVADQPKWDMLKPMRDANLNAVDWRMQAAKQTD